MDPAIGASLITAGGSFLSNLFGGSKKGYKPERIAKAEYEYGKKAAEDRIARAKREGLKPTTPRHEYWSGLSQIAPFMQNAVMGSFKDIFGADTLAKWGSSYTPEGGGGGTTPPQQPAGGGSIAPGGGGGMPPLQRLPGRMAPWFQRPMEEGGSMGRGVML